MNARTAKKLRQEARRNGSSGAKPKGVQANPIYTGELAGELQRQLDENLIPNEEFTQVVRFSGGETVIGVEAPFGSEASEHYYDFIRHTEAQHILIAEKRACGSGASAGLVLRANYREYIANLVAVLRAVSGQVSFGLLGRHGITRIRLSGSLGIEFHYLPQTEDGVEEGTCWLGTEDRAGFGAKR